MRKGGTRVNGDLTGNGKERNRNGKKVTGKGNGLKKFREAIFSPMGTLVMFLLAVVMLLSGSIGGAQAALTYFSETYSSQVQMYDIGVSLLENGEPVSWRNYKKEANGDWDEQTGVLLANMLGEGESLQLGRTYPERLNVRNSGTINQYVRVTIYKYWMINEAGEGEEPRYEKSLGSQALDPSWIRLHLLCDKTAEGSKWLLDEEASTPERTVLYYSDLLYSAANAAEGPFETEDFADTLTIDGALANKVSQSTEVVNREGVNYTRITTTYDYDGVQFQIEARVDAVQEHNAEAAAWSAWGRRVHVSDGHLSLE